MPTWVNIAFSIFDVVWLVVVLIFLYLIWRKGVQHTQQLEQTLIRATMQTAQAAEKAAEAAFVLACKKPDNPTHIIEEGRPPLL